MFKKTFISFVVVFALAVIVVSPALAQDNQANTDAGFWQRLTQLFSSVMSQNPNKNQQNPGSVPQYGQLDTQPRMMKGKEASMGAQPDPKQMEENRLNGLVKAGKITEAQKESIIKEVTRVRTEVEYWSKSTGLDASYIYGGLRGPGMDSGMGPGGQGGPNGGMMKPGDSQRMGPPGRTPQQ